MARMTPPEPWSNTSSPAEYFIFDQIREQLDDHWYALHSVGLTEHRSKPWAEIDFVVIGPPGVFCLEVKGGRVGREEGRWFSKSHDGRTHDLGKGPFDQVAGAQAALRTALVERTPWVTKHLIGWGVVTPDCRFTAAGPDLDPEVVYDERDVNRPFTQFLLRLEHHWSRRYGSRKRLEPKEITRLVDAIRGDFHLAASLRATVHGIERELLRLTEEQALSLESCEDNRTMVVTGGAGTGKTILAAEEARRRAAKGGRVLFCVFSKGLAEHLRTILVDTVDVDVFHLHGLMSSLIRESGMHDRVPRHLDDEFFAVQQPDLAIEALLELDRLESYETLVLDEAQDILTTPNLQFLSACIRGGVEDGCWRVFMDANQNLFGRVDDKAVGLLYSCGPAQMRLRRNCRNTEPIAVMNSLLTGVEFARTLSVQGPVPERLVYRNHAHEGRLLSSELNRLLSQGLDPRDIVVLTPNKRAQSILAHSLPHGPEIVDYSEESNSKRIRHSTIRGFKGLESQAVVVADIEDLSSSRARADLYVACSRARAILTLLCVDSTTEDYLRRAEEFGRELRNRPV